MLCPRCYSEHVLLDQAMANAQRDILRALKAESEEPHKQTAIIFLGLAAILRKYIRRSHEPRPWYVNQLADQLDAALNHLTAGMKKGDIFGTEPEAEPARRETIH